MGYSPGEREELARAAEQALRYIRSCRVEDGGYFFARIPPGSLLDSYFAVKALKMLDQRPERPESLERFVWSHTGEKPAMRIHGIYLCLEILRELDADAEILRSSADGLSLSNDFRASISGRNGLHWEVVSELEPVFEAVSVFTGLGLPFDEEEVARLVRSLRNEDGGYGYAQSSPATTYYALQILSRLGAPAEDPQVTVEYSLRQRGRVYFLEDLFYLTGIWHTIGEVNDSLKEDVSFVLDCQRHSGGFARARRIGIATLECTCYALSVLDRLGLIASSTGRKCLEHAQ